MNNWNYWTGYHIKESARGNQGCQALQYNSGRGNESQQRATSVVCTFHRQQKRCQGELYCLYSSALNNRRGNSGNDSVYFARSWSGNRERGGSVVRWYRYHVQWQRGGSASNKRALAKGCKCTLQWSLPESGNFPQLCFTANQERDR